MCLRARPKIAGDAALSVAHQGERKAALAGESTEIADRSREAYEVDLPPAPGSSNWLVQVGVVDRIPADRAQEWLPRPGAAVVFALPPLRRVEDERPDGRVRGATDTWRAMRERPSERSELFLRTPVCVESPPIGAAQLSGTEEVLNPVGDVL